MSDYCPVQNSQRGYALGLKAIREQKIRRGEIQPSPDSADEMRWAAEGDVPPNQLEAVRNG